MVPRFEPFPGYRYAVDGGAADAVIAPPYDVVDAGERAALAARHPCNSILLELPEPADGLDRYETAAALWRGWVADGTLSQDAPSLYVYRMAFLAPTGEPRHTVGVLGALGLEEPGAGDILPHEQTMPKAKSDRLELLTATQVNLSPVWGLSMASGLSALLSTDGPPDMEAVDDDGVAHSLWRLAAAGQHAAAVAAIVSAIQSAPVVIADGHHRYATGLNYRNGTGGASTGPAPAGSAPAGSDAILALVVELSAEELTVQAIHRLLTGFDPAYGVPALERWFFVTETKPFDESITARMDEAGALALVTADRAWLLEPRPETVAAAAHDLDSARLDVALAGGVPHTGVTFQHGATQVAALVATGAADAGILLRPASVEVIEATARARQLMPPKTTFFWPKPRTGLVFRALAGGA